MLFNGGVTKSALLRERVTGVVDGWQHAANVPPVRVLSGGNADVAVAQGGAYYGRVRTGAGVRIKGGTARAYYVGIERAEPAVPGIAPRIDAVCIAPFGMEEGTEVTLPGELGLVTGEPAQFRFFASSTRRDDDLAAVVDPRQAELTELSPIETMVEGAGVEGEPGRVVPARLQARVSELGTLEVAAIETVSGKRLRLEFNIRVE